MLSYTGNIQKRSKNSLNYQKLPLQFSNPYPRARMKKSWINNVLELAMFSSLQGSSFSVVLVAVVIRLIVQGNVQSSFIWL